jgi:hypothetical protein
MSIKKLFEAAQKKSNYKDYQDEKQAFESVESVRNANEIELKNNTFTPQIDYSDPTNFVKFGSAYYYYKGAITKISEYYPYDGSDAEKNKFYNSLLDVEKYIFDYSYPRTNGFVHLSAGGWGAASSVSADQYGLPATLEYITLKGGPLTSSGDSLVARGPDDASNKTHYSNVYDENIYQTHGLPDDYGKGTRVSNLRSNFDDGVTVEFWLKKDAFDVAKTAKEVVFDMWNNQTCSNAHYARLSVELTGAATGSPFIVTAQSGNTSVTVFQSSIGDSVTTGSLTSWGHYAFSFYNTGSNFMAKLYVNGVLNDTNTYSGVINELNSKDMMGRIGGLLTPPSASAAAAGSGKFSGSLDEFRFWKVARSAAQVGENYFVPVNGGVNTDVSNTTLGIYYKFNEGITGESIHDSVVLDYSGRLSNGKWTGYGSNSRNTGSAIVLASAAVKEQQDPIIRTVNPRYIALSSSLCASGSWFDLNNHASFKNYVPNWIIEQHEELGIENLDIICHIAGAYFDKMYHLAGAVPKFKGRQYTSASQTPVPFAYHLPQSLGLYTPELFIDASIMEKLLNRSDSTVFQNDVEETKDLIYLNLYNNLTNIYKSKGTEKSIRNVLRCFYLDDSLFNLKTYARNTTYEIQNNLQQHLSTDARVNFNTLENSDAIVYQRKDSANAESSGYISGSLSGSGYNYLDPYGSSIEADITFPIFSKTLYHSFQRNFVSSSLFGIHTANTASTDSLDGTVTTWVTNDYANFQVHAVRDTIGSSNVYFRLSSSYYPYPMPYLTSSTFFDVYENERWNLSVRVKPTKFPVASLVSGSMSGSYDVIFRGASSELGVIRRSFEVSGTVNYTVGSNFLKAPKRVYVGAERTNLTGAILNRTDALFSNVKYWTKFLGNETLNQHVFDANNSGISGSQRNISALDLNNRFFDLMNRNTLALEWNFDNVTASNAAGNFVVTDYSSGSLEIRDNYSWLGRITGYQHSGYGAFFATSSTGVVDNLETNMFKFVDPENAVGSNMINILSEDDTVFDITETVPNYLFTFEKSMYNAISEEMLKFLAGVVDFNNLIGEPVNRYRSRYKNIEKLREAFFRRVTSVSDVEKFVDYYKWFDDAISTVVSQMLPASADFIEDTMNVIESHVLERNKYENKFPTLEFSVPDPETAIEGMMKVPRWEFAHSPISASQWIEAQDEPDQAFNTFYWKNMAERDGSEITSKSSTIDSQRETVKNVVSSEPFLSRSLPVFSTPGGTRYTRNTFARRNYQRVFNLKTTNPFGSGSSFKGGVNFEPSKKLDFTYNALRPAGPVNQTEDRYIPENVLIGFPEEFVRLKDDSDPLANPNAKIKRYMKVQHGRNYEDGIGYQSVKSTIAFPFNLISSSVNSGYQKLVNDSVSGNIMITNVHNDVYGPDMETPMQGPFTNYAVGGHQSRHVGLNYSSSTRALDNYRTRPEAWKILLGTCTFKSGAIGMVGPDYPWPEANDEGETPYPMTASQKAIYYRGMTAKRPVNIRNIHHTTGSPTILGNYNENYDFVNTVGAYANPRAFVDNQPTLPSNLFQSTTTSSMTANTWLDTYRRSGILSIGRTPFVADYSVEYLRGNIAGANKSVIRSKFNTAGGPETNTPAYADFRSDSISAYNSWNNRNLSVIKPSQGPSGSWESFKGNWQTGSVRVNDILNKPYGLRSHLARHTARFGRDSLFQTGTSDSYSVATRLQAPGATYSQLPGFHKVHRNNLIRLKKTDQIVFTESKALTNSKSINYRVDQSKSGSALVLTGSGTFADQGAVLYQALTSSGFTYSGWLYFAPGSSVRRFFNMGRTQNGAFAGINLQKTYVSSEHRVSVNIAFANSGDSARGAGEWHVSGAAAETWMHVAVTWTGSNGSLTSVDPKVYLNGTERTLTEDTTPPYAHYPQNWRVPATYKGFSNVMLKGDNMVIFGGNHTNTTWDFSGSMDEVSIWKRPLNAAEITEIYNGGVPCDITASNTYESSSSDLWEWIRMGDGAGTQAILGSNPGVLAPANKITGVANGLLFMPISKTGSANPMTFNTNSPALLSGCPSRITSITETSTFSTSSIYDNFNIKHQIPRSTVQYAWISSSLFSSNDVYGFTRADFLRSNSSGIFEAIDFVTASDLGSVASSTGKYAGPSDVTVALAAVPSEFVLKPSMAGLNYFTIDPIDTNTCMQGTQAGISSYMNTDLMNTTTAFGSASVLNMLNFKRTGPWGFASWKQLRQNDNKILKRQRSLNQVVVSMGTDTPSVYEMPPVSLRGRTGIVNFDMINPDTDPTDFAASLAPTYAIKSTFTNDTIYYNTAEMNDKMQVSLLGFTTPFEQTIEIAKNDYRTNWITYSENIFPSQRNEFLSRSTQRLGYDNLFWRTSRTERNTVGSALSNSFGVYLNRTSGSHLSQSCFALDAPLDFLTRTRVPAFGNTAYVVPRRQAHVLSSGSAGELQNTYSSYLSGAGTQAFGAGAVAEKAQTLFPGALYARKQQTTVPTSVVGSSGIRIPETGSDANRNSPFRVNSQIAMWGAGEAVWQAGTLAGVIRKSRPVTRVETASGIISQTISEVNLFQSTASMPWYNGYPEFNADLKLKSKGFSTVPEFILSNHLQDYLEVGTLNNGKTNTFEIVGTGINSSTLRNSTASFYLDYSNSDFLQEFLKIKQEALMGAKEIKLICSAAVKFVPYKGFYPADRTLQISDRFGKDYGAALRGSCKGGTVGGSSLQKTATGGTLLHLSGGMSKPIMESMFAPGILYNSIKSGLAVDWPIVETPTKYIKIPYGDAAHTDYKNASNWALTVRTGSVLYSTSDDQDYALQHMNRNKTFFDQRLPFETIVYPEKYIRGIQFYDLDSHPSSSMRDVTSSWDGTAGDGYSRMVRNFLGEVADFYLKDSQYTKLESTPIAGDMEFSEGEVYMARLKIYRSMTGERDYSFESGSYNYFGATGSAFTRFGAAQVKQNVNGSDVATSEVTYITDNSYPLPQDPQKAEYRENFTMYSRPSAFGPDISGLSCGHQFSASYYSSSVGGTIYDSFTGHNPAYTPPYYDGQAWVDFIFYPRGNTKYNLAKILTETTASFLRFDAGYLSGTLRRSSSLDHGGPDSIAGASGQRTPLIFTNNDLVNPSDASVSISPSTYPLLAIYSGANINKNSMQASASFNLFGVENVSMVDTNKFDQVTTIRNTVEGQRWVIQPQFETPMLNFNDTGTRPLTSSQLSLPSYGSAAVPRGMWHQFGVIESDTDKGIFMEIGDIPQNWLEYNHLVRNTGSVYNEFSTTTGQHVASKVKSLSSLLGFDNTGNKKRLGELKESMKIKEAVVAVPYVVKSDDKPTARGTIENYTRKEFIEIPQYRFESALSETDGSAAGDSLLSAGESIRRQVTLMENYVMPPEFDFIANRDLIPVAMYIFEFEFEFDQDDLSYMWQNLAPRSYKKFSFNHSEVGHELLTTELLSETNLVDNEELRWMVFKVKQKSQADYYDKLSTQAGQVPFTRGDYSLNAAGYKLAYNWPYDYVSMIERIKIDAEILYSNETYSERFQTDTPNTAGLSQQSLNTGPGYSLAEDSPAGSGLGPVDWSTATPGSAYGSTGPTLGPLATNFNQGMAGATIRGFQAAQTTGPTFTAGATLAAGTNLRTNQRATSGPAINQALIDQVTGDGDY